MKYFESGDNKITTYIYLWNPAKAVIRWKFIDILILKK